MKHPVTGRWHDPVFSLRRQADLCKLARQHGVEELLPFSVKSSAERLRRRQENGLRVKGTGVGERVKGKESERQMKQKCVALNCVAVVLDILLIHCQGWRRGDKPCSICRR
jgi:transposase-like protein